MDRRIHLQRARWRFGLVSLGLFLASTGLLMVALGWPGYWASPPEPALMFLRAGAWLGLAGIVPSALALFLCQRWHRHSVACGGAAAGAMVGTLAFCVSLLLLVRAGDAPPGLSSGIRSPPAVAASGPIAAVEPDPEAGSQRQRLLSRPRNASPLQPPPSATIPSR